jgi:AraC-like DNA-binding protein
MNLELDNVRLADGHMTVRLLLKRTGEAMTESRPSLSPSTVRAEAQQVRFDGTLWNARDSRRVRGGVVQMPKSQALLPAHRSPMIGGHDDLHDFDPPRLSDGDATADVIPPVVEISPLAAVKRRTVRGYGMVAESVQSTSQGGIQHRFRAPVHLLVMYEKGVRRDGETFVEGLPRSTLRNLERKLTFVPAGHEYHEWHEPRGRTIRLMHFYFDPSKLKIDSELAVTNMSGAPRLLFEDATLWHTALKLKAFAESPTPGDRLYFETLGTLLVHEIVRLNCGVPSIQPQVRGGLAPWQQRIVTAYIEEHLKERVSLATLAQLIRLSPWHFSRAFKHSLGTPPHRYLTNRRMEHAKLLLAERAVSVTEIGLTLGFSSPNAFATAFRKATGITPTDYRRSVAPPMTYE